MSTVGSVLHSKLKQKIALRVDAHRGFARADPKNICLLEVHGHVVSRR